MRIAVYRSCGAKKYGFGSTNVTKFWYLVMLKITIWLSSTTNTSAHGSDFIQKERKSKWVKSGQVGPGLGFSGFE